MTMPIIDVKPKRVSRYGLTILVIIATTATMYCQIPAGHLRSSVLPSTAEMAAYRGDRSTVLKLLDNGLDVNHVGRDGLTMLTYAVSGQHPGLVRALLARGARPDADHGAAMLQAAGSGDLPILTELLAAGASPNEHAGDMLNTPLIASVSTGKLEVMKLLLQSGADPNARNRLGRTALFTAAAGWSKALNYLIGHGANVNISDKDGITPLIYASMYGNLTIVGSLLKAGADPDKVDNSGRKAEDYASEGGFDKLVKMLQHAKNHK